MSNNNRHLVFYRSTLPVNSKSKQIYNNTLFSYILHFIQQLFVKYFYGYMDLDICIYLFNVGPRQPFCNLNVKGAVLWPPFCSRQANWAERPSRVMRRSEIWNTLKIYPGWGLNPDSIGMWPATLLVRLWKRQRRFTRMSIS